jgi:hypothetical protein
MKNMKYLILDTGTTGISKRSEVLKIAVIDSDIVVLLNTFITHEWSKNRPEAEKIHGITPGFIFSAGPWQRPTAGGSFPTLKSLKNELLGIHPTEYR